MKNKIIGIYSITNKTNGNFYIGSSVQIHVRWSQHKGSLNKKTHHSPILQAAWNKYGKENFDFKILEECSKEIILEREQYYLGLLKPTYNTEKVAGKPPVDAARSSKTAKANWAAGLWDNQKRPIERIDPETGEIKEYASISEAVAEGYTQACIWYCISGKTSTYSNYYWVYADGSSPNTTKKYTKIFYKVIGKNKINDSEIILSSFDECHKLGFNYGKIRACCAGLSGRRLHKDYEWHFFDDKRQNIAQANKKPTFAETFSIAIVGTCIKDGTMLNYSSMAAATKDGFKQGEISRCCSGHRQSHAGYRWHKAS